MKNSVTESAFANPMFVEDVVRSAAQQLEAHPQVQWFREVESYESIHAHNAFALLNATVSPKRRLLQNSLKSGFPKEGAPTSTNSEPYAYCSF